jgi:hypothetical protein
LGRGSTEKKGEKTLIRNAPYQIADGVKIPLVIMNATDGLPAAFALMATRAEKKVAARLLGGCKGMGAADKRAMLEFFATAFKDYRGLVWSGGTRQATKEGEVDPMVTDIPGIIAAANPGCIALGTIPRTAMLTLQENSRLVLDEWGTAPNPDMSGILIVQNGADGTADWDGDVATYFAMMDQWKTYAGFAALGTVAWNGGPITEKEILMSAARGWPTILIKGSGRVADEMAAKLQAGDADLLAKFPKGHRVAVISKDDPEGLRRALVLAGFFPS